MTMFKCHCGLWHDSTAQGECPHAYTLTSGSLISGWACVETDLGYIPGHYARTLTLRSAPDVEPTPESVGREIRRLLMTLHASGHTTDDERSGHMSYGTDGLRMRALDLAGICWLKPGEMAPGCCCPWTPESPEGPRLALEERMDENRKLWDDECILRDFRTERVCSRGVNTCVVKHRGGHE